jgi:hypothetical protein
VQLTIAEEIVMDVDRLLYWFLTRSVVEKLLVMAAFVILMIGMFLLAVMAISTLVEGAAVVAPMILSPTIQYLFG